MIKSFLVFIALMALLTVGRCGFPDTGEIVEKLLDGSLRCKAQITVPDRQIVVGDVINVEVLLHDCQKGASE